MKLSRCISDSCRGARGRRRIRYGQAVTLSAILILTACSAANGQTASDRKEIKDRIEAALLGELDRPIAPLIESPRWISPTLLQYRLKGPEAAYIMRFDVDSSQADKAFDHRLVADLLSKSAGQRIDADMLATQIAAVHTDDDGRAVSFDHAGQGWKCNLAGRDQSCTSSAPRAFPGAEDLATSVTSPNGRFHARMAEDNVHITDSDGKPILSTEGGTQYFQFGSLLLTAPSGQIQLPLRGLTPPISGAWSANSRRFLTVLVDARHVPVQYLTRSLPDNDYSRRPDILPFRKVLATDEQQVQLRYVVLDVGSERVLDVDMPWVDAALYANFWWRAGSNDEFFFITHTRDQRSVTLWLANLAGQRVERVYSETGDYRVAVNSNTPNVVDIPGRDEVVWASNRDGIDQLYLVSLATKAIKHRISRGAVAVAEILYVDTSSASVYFLGHPQGTGIDPLQTQLYRASLDGSSQERLTDISTHHDILFSPDGKSYLDVESRIDMLPRATLRRIDGSATVLAVAEEQSWALPEEARPRRFRVMAADGKTELFGNIYRPSTWRHDRRYPIIDLIYGSAEFPVATPSFDAGNWPHSWAQPLAEAGFIVIVLDARGTPGRTREFNALGMGEGHNECGYADHAAAIRQLAESDETIDPNRSGVFGWSGGGQCAFRLAMLAPTTFSSAVLGAPSSDPYLNGSFYIENFLGRLSERPELFEEGATPDNLRDISGPVLLIHGELDEDTPPSNSLRIARQLIDEGMYFEMLLVPGAGHSAFTPYVATRVADFFSRHMLDRPLIANSDHSDTR